jgi:hypothetical protein
MTDTVSLVGQFKAGRIPWAAWPSTRAVLDAVRKNDPDESVKANANKMYTSLFC